MKVVPLLKIFVILIAIPSVQVAQQPVTTKIHIDAGIRNHTIDGFGVNINAAWWLDGDYRNSDVTEKAIDMLIDSLGATLFRVVIEEMDWEEANDDHDPGNFNWDYYNRIFSNNRFKGTWNTLHYLNERGITDNLIISFMGGPPASAPQTPADPVKSWMGNTNFSISETLEDEFVESIAALLFYARNNEKINFTLVSPMNETDIISSTKGTDHPNGIVEGPDMPDAVQFVRVIRKLAEKLDKIGMGDIRFVAPDAAADKLFNACFDEMIKDSYLMGKLACWGVHQYGKDADNYLAKIRNSQNPVKKFWVTETAGIRNILGQLNDSVSAHIYWDGYDCVYQHARRNGYGSIPPNDWVFWEGEQGKPLLAYDSSDQSWTPRKQFFEFAQLFRFVSPGALTIGVSCDNPEIPVHAYLNPSGQLVIFGRNNSRESVAVRGNIISKPDIARLKMFITNDEANLKTCTDVLVSKDTWQAVIPAETVFTLTGIPGK